MKSNHKLFLWQLFGNLAYCIQMLLMGAFSGAATLVITTSRNFILLQSDKLVWCRSRIILGILLSLLVVTTFFTWNGPVSILPFACGIITTAGFWTFNARTIRLTQLAGSIFFLVYDSIIGSWGGIIAECLSSTSILLSIVRFGWKNLGKE